MALKPFDSGLESVGDVNIISAGDFKKGGTKIDADYVGAVDRTLFTTAGDLLAGTGASTYTTLPVGTDGQIPYADSGAEMGISWGDPPSGGGSSDIWPGMMIAFHANIKSPALSVPTGWKVCDGTTISGGTLNGIATPDLIGWNGGVLNGTRRFLRGAPTSGGTGGSESHSHALAWTGICQGTIGTTKRVLEPGTTDTANTSTLPSFFEVLWLIKI